MGRVRVIPVLLLKDNGLVKTMRFKNEVYIGDPINAVKIFNEKEVDELIILDISATSGKKKPNIDMISNIASECFMSLCYGGGITTLDEIKKLLFTGIEKVSLNSSAAKKSTLITEAATLFGSQSIVVSIDVKKNIFGQYSVFTNGGTVNLKRNPAQFAKEMQEKGAGEIFLTSIDKEGTGEGYDLELIQKVSSVLTIPLIACGGAGNIIDFSEAVQSGASAVAAGSMFVFQGKLKGVLINFPSQESLAKQLYALQN